MTPKPKAAVVTHGCRYNHFESAEITRHLEDNGFNVVPESQQADLYVINTCTVTGKSDSKSRNSIRKMSVKNKDAAIVVTGCYSQMNPREITEQTSADLVIGNMEKHSVADYMKKAGMLHGGRVRKNHGPDRIYSDGLAGKPEFKSLDVNQIPGRTKAYLKIQSGCAQTCSFCVVTLARGDSVSEKPQNVKKRFEKLVQAGYREITLTGIHLGSYGLDLNPETCLSDLLEDLLTIEGRFRIRLSSLGPAEINGRLVDLMRRNPKICNYLHLSMQSGDDSILKAMRRNYDSGKYRKIFQEIFSKVGDIGIGADVMAGFPGEDEENFKKTISMIEELPFAYLHVFNYSERPGTDAVKLSGKVSKKVREDRAKKLKETGLKKSLEFREKFMGTTREVLVEGKRDKGSGLLKGHTDNYIPVLMEGGDGAMNCLKQVRLHRMEGLTVFGEII